MATDPSYGRLLDGTPTAAALDQATQLVFESFDDFYGYIPLDRDVLFTVIAQQIQDPRTECFDPLIARIDGRVVGVICSFPAAELAERQRKSSLDFIKLLDRDGRQKFKQAMSAGNHSAAPLPDLDGTYISRVAISDDMRGRGLGRAFLRRFMELNAGRKIVLHVDQSNIAAQRMYSAMGFDTLMQPEYRKIVMQSGGL